jgi:phenylalanyl-tRNA synthetase alpha chain
MPDVSDIDRLRSEFRDELSRVGSEADLKNVRDRYLGRKGSVVASLMKAVASARTPEDRRAQGLVANQFKTEVEQALSARLDSFRAAREPAGSVDVTLPGRDVSPGHRHPLSVLREQIESIFARMGYEIVEGPEAEDDYHNFEALNMPPEHPARDMQDTLYIGRPIPQSAATGESRPATLLRTHTSAMQIRYMESHRPPVRIIALGKVFRRDNLDLTHTPMFSQFEGLVVGEGVTMADLKGTLTSFVREIFARDTRVLFRPSFFPYTEPSAEVFIGCIFCGGSGCPVCKRTGWLEILGSGMVHPAVFEAVGYDPERYTGFAFGTGIERVAMLKYKVDDIRLFYENDLRFLEQFPY